MRRTCSCLLVLAFLVLACTGTAFARDPVNVVADYAVGLTNADVPKGLELYVKSNEDEGLKGKVKVALDLVGGQGTLYLPGTVDTTKLFLSWSDKDMTLQKGNQVYTSGKAPIAKAGKSMTYTVSDGAKTFVIKVKTMQGSTDVAPMFLTLDESKGTIEAMNADESHETSCYGKVKYNGVKKAISMKGRGNSTWSGPLGAVKKPYNITFYDDATYEDTKKVELIPGVKAKKWSLVANFADNSLLRNKIAMDLADSLGIGLKCVFVDVWMNGEYLGNYTMTPKNDYNAPDGGYALENDNYIEPEDSFEIPGMFEIGTVPGVSVLGSGYHNRISIKDIGKDAEAKGVTNKKIEQYFNKAWVALEDYDSEAYQNYFDLDSWAKMFLMYEVSKTYDCYAGSLLMHRDGLSKGDKLIAGPAWDYDVSFGRTLHKFFVGVAEPVQVNAEGWYNDSIGMMAVDKPISLLQELGKHKSFMKHVSEVFNDNEAAFEAVENNVTRQAAFLRDSALMNNEKYGTHSLCAEYVVAPETMKALGTGKYKLNYEITTSYDSYIHNLKEYCNKRVLWLSDHLTPGTTIVTEHGGVVKL